MGLHRRATRRSPSAGPSRSARAGRPRAGATTQMRRRNRTDPRTRSPWRRGRKVGGSAHPLAGLIPGFDRTIVESSTWESAVTARDGLWLRMTRLLPAVRRQGRGVRSPIQWSSRSGGARRASAARPSNSSRASATPIGSRCSRRRASCSISLESYGRSIRRRASRSRSDLGPTDTRRSRDARRALARGAQRRAPRWSSSGRVRDRGTTRAARRRVVGRVRPPGGTAPLRGAQDSELRRSNARIDSG